MNKNIEVLLNKFRYICTQYSFDMIDDQKCGVKLDKLLKELNVNVHDEIEDLKIFKDGTQKNVNKIFNILFILHKQNKNNTKNKENYNENYDENVIIIDNNISQRIKNIKFLLKTKLKTKF